MNKFSSIGSLYFYLCGNYDEETNLTTLRQTNSLAILPFEFDKKRKEILEETTEVEIFGFMSTKEKVYQFEKIVISCFKKIINSKENLNIIFETIKKEQNLDNDTLDFLKFVTNIMHENNTYLFKQIIELYDDLAIFFMYKVADINRKNKYEKNQISY